MIAFSDAITFWGCLFAVFFAGIGTGWQMGWAKAEKSNPEIHVVLDSKMAGPDGEAIAHQVADALAAELRRRQAYGSPPFGGSEA